MSNFCDTIMDSPQLKCLYFAAVLVLLLLIIMQLWKVGYFMSEQFQGRSSENAALNVAQPSYKAALTSGADVRFSQMMTGANMSVTDGSATGTGRDAQGRPLEPLVSTRGEPDFWEIGSELGAYKRSLAGAAPSGIQGPGSAQLAQIQAAQAADAGVAAGEYFTDGWMGGNFAQDFRGAPARLGESFVGGVDLEAQMRGL
jgi:hypothetical protein